MMGMMRYHRQQVVQFHDSSPFAAQKARAFDYFHAAMFDAALVQAAPR
jgi:hypothetical protein